MTKEEEEAPPKKSKRRKAPRKPSFRPAFIPELRIVKRDIRRKYPEMMLNVMNSHDIKLLESFYDTFTVPNVEVIDRDAPASVYEDYQWPKYSKGTQRYLQAMNMSFQLFPDAVFYLEDVQISVILRERGSRITGKIRAVRTQVHGIKFLNQQKIEEKQDADNDQHPSYELIPLETPLLNEVEGRVIFYLDENHRLERAQIIFNRFTLTPLVK